MSEQLAWFESVVPVQDRTIGVTRNICHAMEAADFLHNRWPRKPLRSHQEARKAVAEALERYGDHYAVRNARDAFAKAVQEAGMAGYPD